MKYLDRHNLVIVLLTVIIIAAFSVILAVVFTPSLENIAQVGDRAGKAIGDLKLEPIEICQNEKGNWLVEYSECENIGLRICEKNGGVFNACSSACRHNPEAEVCTEQCVPVCVFYDQNQSAEIFAKLDLIQVDYPKPGDYVSSPLTITGKARGNWFFEASFPVSLVNWDGLIIAQGIATAKGDWMTTEFVSFEAKLEFDQPTYKNNGALILKKDNPSGLPENDDSIEIPIFFK